MTIATPERFTATPIPTPEKAESELSAPLRFDIGTVSAAGTRGERPQNEDTVYQTRKGVYLAGSLGDEYVVGDHADPGTFQGASATVAEAFADHLEGVDIEGLSNPDVFATLKEAAKTADQALATYSDKTMDGESLPIGLSVVRLFRGEDGKQRAAIFSNGPQTVKRISNDGKVEDLATARPYESGAPGSYFSAGLQRNDPSFDAHDQIQIVEVEPGDRFIVAKGLDGKEAHETIGNDAIKAATHERRSPEDLAERLAKLPGVLEETDYPYAGKALGDPKFKASTGDVTIAVLEATPQKDFNLLQKAAALPLAGVVKYQLWRQGRREQMREAYLQMPTRHRRAALAISSVLESGVVVVGATILARSGLLSMAGHGVEHVFGVDGHPGASAANTHVHAAASPSASHQASNAPVAKPLADAAPQPSTKSNMAPVVPPANSGNSALFRGNADVPTAAGAPTAQTPDQLPNGLPEQLPANAQLSPAEQKWWEDGPAPQALGHYDAHTGAGTVWNKSNDYWNQLGYTHLSKSEKDDLIKYILAHNTDPHTGKPLTETGAENLGDNYQVKLPDHADMVSEITRVTAAHRDGHALLPDNGSPAFKHLQEAQRELDSQLDRRTGDSSAPQSGSQSQGTTQNSLTPSNTQGGPTNQDIPDNNNTNKGAQAPRPTASPSASSTANIHPSSKPVETSALNVPKGDGHSANYYLARVTAVGVGGALGAAVMSPAVRSTIAERAVATRDKVFEALSRSREFSGLWATDEDEIDDEDDSSI